MQVTLHARAFVSFTMRNLIRSLHAPEETHDLEELPLNLHWVRNVCNYTTRYSFILKSF